MKKMSEYPTNRGWDDIKKAEKQRNDAVSLLKSLSVPEPLLNQLVSESMTGFILIVGQDGIMEFVSDSAINIVGYLPSKIQGESIFNFFPSNVEVRRFSCFLRYQLLQSDISNMDPGRVEIIITDNFEMKIAWK